METAHGPGESRTPRPPPALSDDADILVLGSASHLWKNPRSVDIRDRINEISNQFTSAGWKNLPQELVDEILGYLLDDLGALKAFSLTCKCLFGATRPLVHQRVVCVDPRPTVYQPKGSVLPRLKGSPGAFEQLIDTDRSGVLRYTIHLTFKPGDDSCNPPFEPGDLQEYLPQLRSITKLHTLTLDHFHISRFTPVFNEHFGMFTNTLRHLDIRGPLSAKPDLLYFISQFHLLEDLTIVFPLGQAIPHPWHPVLTIVRSPPLRGKLVLAETPSRGLSDGLAAFPGGLNFRSLELHLCRHPQPIFEACGHTVTSISFLFSPDDTESESNTSIQLDATM